MTIENVSGISKEERVKARLRILVPGKYRRLVVD